MATGIVENRSLLIAGGSEVDWYKTELLLRKPPQREGYFPLSLAANELVFQANRKQPEANCGALKASYVFRNEGLVSQFLFEHYALSPILLAAVPELKQSFGEDVLLYLEVLCEEGEPASLYAIAMWRGSPEQAEMNLYDFDERWWLNQRPQRGLTFTYELS